MPSGIYSRSADNWKLLLAIADAASGEWPERAQFPGAGTYSFRARRFWSLAKPAPPWANQTADAYWISKEDAFQVRVCFWFPTLQTPLIKCHDVVQK
jgi:hypothetical protein